MCSLYYKQGGSYNNCSGANFSITNSIDFFFERMYTFSFFDFLQKIKHDLNVFVLYEKYLRKLISIFYNFFKYFLENMDVVERFHTRNKTRREKPLRSGPTSLLTEDMLEMYKEFILVRL